MLSSRSIRELITTQNLLSGFPNLEGQLQQNGIDLTVRSIEKLARPSNHSSIMISENVRIGLDKEAVGLLPFENVMYYPLPPNSSFIVTLNERVKLPTNVAALARPRSSFLRNGINIHTAVWDAGYEGNSSVLLQTSNHFAWIGENTRIVQMIFFELDQATNAYAGAYQGEG